MLYRTLTLFAAIALHNLPLTAQSIKKIPLSTSGCSLYTYCDFSFEVSKSRDSSIVYAGDCTRDSITYGVICVQLINPPENLQMAESLLMAYLDFLKENFEITQSAGYGTGHRLNNNENTRGLLDYWKDREKNNWKIKGWTDGKFIAVLYTYSLKLLPEPKVSLFLDGFRLPVK
jgi:hypothetical protein